MDQRGGGELIYSKYIVFTWTDRNYAQHANRKHYDHKSQTQSGTTVQAEDLLRTVNNVQCKKDNIRFCNDFLTTALLHVDDGSQQL